MNIIKAQPGDATILTQIAFEAKRHWGYPEHWVQFWRETLTITEGFILEYDTFVALEHEVAVGFYSLWIQPARIELQHLWVLPAAMGKGIGRSLFFHAAERAKGLGFPELEMESDPNAEGFYLRMGAIRVGAISRPIDQQNRELPMLLYKIG